MTDPWTSRRLNMRLLGLLMLPLMFGWYLSARIALWFPFVILGAAFVVLLVVVFIPELRRPEPELGEVVFSAPVRFKASRLRLNGVGLSAGRLLVGQDAIATRAAFVPHVLGKLFGWDYTLRAADFEVCVGYPSALSRIVGAATYSPSLGLGTWPSSVILRGPYGRGWLELEFAKAGGATPGEVLDALISAGARNAAGAVST